MKCHEYQLIICLFTNQDAVSYNRCQHFYQNLRMKRVGPGDHDQMVQLRTVEPYTNVASLQPSTMHSMPCKEMVMSVI